MLQAFGMELGEISSGVEGIKTRGLVRNSMATKVGVCSATKVKSD